MRRTWLAALIGAPVAILVLVNTFFLVDERQQAVVVGLAGPVRVINPPGAHDPGLKVKIPFAEWLVMLDRRSQAADMALEPVVSADQQPLLIEASLRYRITDPIQFYRSLGDETTAPARLEPVVGAALRDALGKASAAEIIAHSGAAATDAALGDVRGRAAGARLGVEIVDMQLRQVALPPASAQTVYQRMNADIQTRTTQARTQGEASRRDIMARADNQATVIADRANENAAATRGAGDAQAAQLYAVAYGRDPEFAAFYRTMRAYRTALAQKNATLVLSPDDAFFKYFRQGPRAR